MKRSFLFSIGLVVVFAMTSFAQDATPAPSPSPKPKPTINKKAIQAQLVKIENELWKAFGDKNGKPFQAHLSADGVMVDGSGLSTKAEAVKMIEGNDCQIKSWKLSGYKLVMADSSVAILAYMGEQEGTCGGQAIPPKVYATSTYVRRGGAWLAISHVETPAR